MYQASRLADVRYDIRGPVLRRADELAAAGHEIIKLNIGNPAPFGLFTPDAVLSSVAASLGDSQGYSEARGIRPARIPPRPIPSHRIPSHRTRACGPAWPTD